MTDVYINVRYDQFYQSSEITSAATMTYERPSAQKQQSPEKGLRQAFRVWSGARESAAAHDLYRPTHERPASTTNRESRRSVGVATAARIARDGVTGSARSVGLHPSWHLVWNGT